MFTNTLVPVVSTAHLVVRRLIGIIHHAHTLGAARTYPKSEGSSMTPHDLLACFMMENLPPSHLGGGNLQE